MKNFSLALLGAASYAYKIARFGVDFVRLNWPVFSGKKTCDQDSLDADDAGISKDHAHPLALALISDEFFWDCTDELAPFGSDEGDTALYEWRTWRAEHGDQPALQFVVQTIEEVGEIPIARYSMALCDPKLMEQQLADKRFDDQQFIYTLDISVIATVFGQLVDEGVIDADTKPYARIALQRQVIYAELWTKWPHRFQYIANLQRLQKLLEEA